MKESIGLEEFVAKSLGKSCRPRLPTAVMTLPHLPSIAGVNPEDYIHRPYTPKVITWKTMIWLRMGRFFTSLGKYTGFSRMVNTLRKLLHRTPNSSS
jgi:hypothetical protein